MYCDHDIMSAASHMSGVMSGVMSVCVCVSVSVCARACVCVCVCVCVCTVTKTGSKNSRHTTYVLKRLSTHCVCGGGGGKKQIDCSQACTQQDIHTPRLLLWMELRNCRSNRRPGGVLGFKCWCERTQ